MEMHFVACCVNMQQWMNQHKSHFRVGYSEGPLSVLQLKTEPVPISQMCSQNPVYLYIFGIFAHFI